MIILYTIFFLAANRLSLAHLEEARSYAGKAHVARNQGIFQSVGVHARNWVSQSNSPQGTEGCQKRCKPGHGSLHTPASDKTASLAKMLIFRLVKHWKEDLTKLCLDSWPTKPCEIMCVALTRWVCSNKVRKQEISNIPFKLNSLIDEESNKEAHEIGNIAIEKESLGDLKQTSVGIKRFYSELIKEVHIFQMLFWEL